MKPIIHQTKELLCRALKDRRRIIAVLCMLTVFSMLIVTFSWYKSQVSLGGSTFSTGNLDFIATGYDQDGNLVTTVLQEGKSHDGYVNVNQPLFQKVNWQAGVTDTAFLAIENTGSLPMDFKIGFTASGQVEYLGGFWYALTDITSDIVYLSGNDQQKLQHYIAGGYNKQAEENGYNMATMDRYATMGSVDNTNTKRYYRMDYGMKATAITEQYTDKQIEVFMAIHVTQPGAFEADASTGYTYNCSTVQDINRAIEQALPGDSIRLLNQITYEGDLVINKPINLLTNNFTLEVLGNLIYNYVAPVSLTVNVTGNGRIVVASPSEGVGGNMMITTPNSDVRIIGANSAIGDIAIDGDFTVQATRSYGAAGATLSSVKLVNKTSNALLPIYVESNTRVTVANNTTVYKLQAVNKASNIEIQNAGTIQSVVLTNMNTSALTGSPQILIVNAANITNTIQLPAWSEKFVSLATTPISYKGNTRIVQTITGNNMTVSGATAYNNSHIEKESTDVTVAPMGEGNGRLIVYYQDTSGQPGATIQSLLTEYFNDLQLDPASSIAAVTELQIISVGDKAITSADIAFIKGDQMASLTSLDLERAVLYDTGSKKYNCLGTSAFAGASKLKHLVLPQTLEEIGTLALSRMNTNILITIPASVTTFGEDWYIGGRYIAYASPAPVSGATKGMDDVQAVFVEEAYIEAYQNAYSSFRTRIYPTAQMDDTSTHFVRQLSGTNFWEIVCYVGANTGEISIGSNVRVGGQPIQIIGVGANSYRNTLNGAQPIISFADTVEYIGENAFYGTTVTRVNGWGSHMKTLHQQAFYNANRLSDVASMPASMETVETRAFSGCTALKTINTGGATYLGVYVFENCSSMTYAELPKVETIGDGVIDNYVFYKCSNLVSVSAPSLYQVNKGYTFAYCKALREIVLGSDKAVTLGSGNVFYQASSAQIKLFVPEPLVEDYRTYSTLGGINSLKIYPIGEKMGDNSATYGYNIGDYIVSDKLNGDGTVTLITSNLSYSDSVTLPSEWNGKPITSIYENAFRNQTFTNVTLHVGSNMKTIGKYAFNGLNGIVGELVLPDSMTEIKDSAFSNCKGITSVNTGGTVTLGSSVFTTCSNMVTANLPNVVTVGNGTDNASTFSSCSSLVSVSVPKLTTVNKNYFLSSCNSLREIYMGSTDDSLTLGTSPFNSISTANQKLIKLYVPASALEFYSNKKPGSIPASRIYAQGTKFGENLVNGYNIGEYIYSVNDDNTASLITSNLSYSGAVTLPDSFDGHNISIIGGYAFANQTFTDVSLTVGNSAKTIDLYAFSDVTGLTSVDLRNVATLNGYCFNGASGLVNVIANKLITMIGSYNFGSCTKLTAINLPELVTMEGGSNFRGCTALVTARLPKLKTMVGGYNFYGCTKLQSVYFEQIVSFVNTDFNNASSLKETIINKVINTTADMPTVSGNLSYGNIVVPMAYQSFYTSRWKNRPVVTMDNVFTDANSNQYFFITDGNECTISYFLGGGTALTIPETVTVDGETYTVIAIQPNAFNSVATMLETITLPAGLHTFDSKTLAEVTTLATIEVASGNRSFVSKNGVLYTKDGQMLLRYPKGNTAASYVVDDATVAIGAYAFEGASNLSAITFGNNLAAIDSTAFEGCAPATITFTGNTPPILMGTGIFESVVSGFSINVPDGMAETYVRGVNFTEYAPFINEGTAIPTGGDMNQTPWSSGGVEQAALPPVAAQIAPLFKDEEDDEPRAL